MDHGAQLIRCRSQYEFMPHESGQALAEVVSAENK